MTEMMTTCPDCKGDGISFDYVEEECDECDGEGFLDAIDCVTCEGFDEDCPDCYGQGIIRDVACPKCDGLGIHEYRPDCSNCSGTGWIPNPEVAPEE